MNIDCFKTQYYDLNRKMLLVTGQWPYQNYSDRVKIWILYTVIMMSGIAVQVARATKSEMDFDLCVEFISETLVWVITVIRYFTFTVFDNKIRTLLDKMKVDWRSLLDDGELEVFCQCAEEGRLYVLHYAAITYLGISMFVVMMVSSPLLVYTPFFNETCPILMMYSKEYILDPQKYCFALVVHISIVIVLLMTGAFATDTMYMGIIHHAIGMFRLTCYRLEHCFDNYTEETKYSASRTYVCDRIAKAVECHRTSIRFCDDIVAAFEWSNLISLGMTLLSIAVAIYWAAVSKGQGGVKVLLAVTIGSGLMIHVFAMDIPAQKMIDYSGAVIFKAYSSLWYMGRAKDQTLLLLTMQRGLKPSAMIIGRMYPATLENFATEVQASLSYFTVLLSLQ